MTVRKQALQETLEAEFCPPLETTLVAAFVSDYLLETSGQDALLPEALQTLRDHLSVLAASAAADQDDITDDLSDMKLSSQSVTTDDSRDTDSVFDLCGENSSSSGSSVPPQGQACTSSSEMHSALVFLRASFPHLSNGKLKSKLKDAELYGELDMERVVEELLSEEYVRELEERGLEDEDTLAGEADKWDVVSKKPRVTKTRGSKKQKNKGTTIVIGDVRQTQLARQTKLSASHRSAGDPWNQINSIATYLETLLPSYQSSYFMSYFHKPEYGSPADALRAALVSIKLSETSPPSLSSYRSSFKPDQASALIPFLEFVCSSADFDYDNLDFDARARLCTDAELVLVATKGSPDAALDVLNLLHELETDKDNLQEMGVYHSPVSPLTWLSPEIQSVMTPNSTRRSLLSPVPNTPSSTPPSPVTSPRPPPAPHQTQSQNDWQEVKPTRPKAFAVHPLAAFIPAYNPNNVPRRKTRGAGNGLGKSGKGDVGELAAAGRARAGLGLGTGASASMGSGVIGDSFPYLAVNGAGAGYRGRLGECRARRDEALRTASRHWAGGSTRTRGGEVALFYAMEAQKLQEEARRLKLDAARELVEGKRVSAATRETIDLHYCTTTEATTIVREVLDEGWVSAARPLHIITGRGSHSTGGVGVLGPVVKNALEREGWLVGKLEGGLVVRGRK